MNNTDTVRRRYTSLLAALLLCTLLAPAAWAQVERTVPKNVDLGKVYGNLRNFETDRPPETNPFLGFLPAGANPNWDYWYTWLQAKARERSELSVSVFKNMTINHAESEALGQGGVYDVPPGTNETPATAEPIVNFGTGPGEDNEAIVTGNFAESAPLLATIPLIELVENGSIGTATPTGLLSGTVAVFSAPIGDGAHGSAGTGTGDYDWYRISGLSAGEFITIEVQSSEDLVAGLYDANGSRLRENVTPFFGGGGSFFQAAVPSDGDYYVVVRGNGFGFQSDPFDPASGGGAGAEGAYVILLGRNDSDIDCFSFDLDAGDILGAAVSGTAAPIVSVQGPDETVLMSAFFPMNATGAYPLSSPLPSGGNAAGAIVARTSDTYTACIAGLPGGTPDDAWTLNLQVFRPNFETPFSGNQIVVLDFDGETVNPSKWGGPNENRVISPLSSFLAGWGLAPEDEDDVIDAIVAVVEENLASSGLNGDYSVEVRNSRDDPGVLFGDPNVTRVIIGGTIAELGISTIGIAENIDVGNFDPETDSIVLLDLLSENAANPNSLNQFGLAGGATIIDLIGQGVGNIATHEAGHTFGLFHTNQFNDTPNIIDQGGNLANSVGVGPDGVFETPGGFGKTAAGDDIDVDIVIDTYVSNEGFTGREDNPALVAWGLTFDSPLPVELVTFNGRADGDDVLLSWSTASELNNAGFAVEHEVGGRFKEIAFVEGHGTTVALHTYSHRVTDLAVDTHRFRLRQVDYDGAFEYSPEIEVTVELASVYQLSAAYPNPFNPSTTFTLAVREEQAVRVEIFDLLGRQVKTLHQGVLAANTQHRVRLDGDGLASGLYLYRVVGTHFMSEPQRITLIK